MTDESLKNYIGTNILPLYDDFDAAHQRNHVAMVIEQSLQIAADLDVNMDMVYAIAAYHDTGLTASSTPTQSFFARFSMVSPTTRNSTKKVTGNAPSAISMRNMPKAVISDCGLITAQT